MRSAPSANVSARIDSAAGAVSAAPRPWTAAGGDELAQRAGQAGGQRRRREQGEAGDQHVAPAEQVGGPPAEQQEAAERQAVGDDDPLQVGLGDAEVGLDRRQGHVHDGEVEHDHELRPAARAPG